MHNGRHPICVYKTQLSQTYAAVAGASVANWSSVHVLVQKVCENTREEHTGQDLTRLAAAVLHSDGLYRSPLKAMRLLGF